MLSVARLKTSKTNELILGKGLSFSVPIVDDEPTYAERVIATGPIAYWILGEAAGPTAVDQINSPAQDGTYTGGLLGQPGIGDGNTSLLTDGVNDFVDIYSVPFRDAFDGAECTVNIWAKVFNVGVWTDGDDRIAVALRTDLGGANATGMWMGRHATNSTIRYYRKANLTEDFYHDAGHSDTDWICLGMTVSEVADLIVYYFNGVEVSNDIGLGVWFGQLLANSTLIGGVLTGGFFPWYGWLAHCAVWDRPLTAPQMLDLATV